MATIATPRFVGLGGATNRPRKSDATACGGTSTDATPTVPSGSAVKVTHGRVSDLPPVPTQARFSALQRNTKSVFVESGLLPQSDRGRPCSLFGSRARTSGYRGLQLFVPDSQPRELKIDGAMNELYLPLLAGAWAVAAGCDQGRGLAGSAHVEHESSLPRPVETGDDQGHRSALIGLSSSTHPGEGDPAGRMSDAAAIRFSRSSAIWSCGPGLSQRRPRLACGSVPLVDPA